MGFLLPALTAEKFETQREVVLNEQRRQNYENRPYGLVPVALMAALYPPRHPYHWLTIGDPDDVRAAGLADVKAFFAAYYHPANASLAIAGDVRTGAAFEAARRHFGDIPAGPRPAPPPLPAEPAPAGERRLLLVDRVELPRLYLAWRTPPLYAPGDAECDLLAEILGGGKSSRLYRALVHDRQIATDVSAGQSSHELSSSFGIVATAAPGHDLAALEAVIAERAGDPAERRPHRRRGGAEPHQRRSRLRLPGADRGRVRRPLRSAQRLQRAHRRSGLRPDRPRALRGRDAGRGRARGRHLPERRRPRRAERRAGRQGSDAALPDSERVHPR